MRDQILQNVAADISLIKSAGGVFEVTVDGELVFSKKNLSRFPTDEEVGNIGT